MNRSWENLTDYYYNGKDCNGESLTKEEMQDFRLMDVYFPIKGLEHKNTFHLQGCGVAIVLKSDGTWFFEDTTGG